MLETARRVFALLSSKERRQAYVLLGMISLMAILDAVGVASTMPFMAVLAEPEIVESNQWLNTAYTTIGFSNKRDFLLFLGQVFFAVFVFSILFRAVTTWALTRYAQMRNYSIARRLISGYLGQPYEWFLSRHSADIGKTILSEVQLVVQGSLVPLMQLVAQAAVVIAIFAMLVAVDPMLALIVGGGLGGTYWLIFRGLRRLLDRIGGDRVVANAKRFKAVGDAFGGIKEVKLGGLERDALAKYDSPAEIFARTQVTAQVAGLMPRFALEILTFGGMMVMLLFLMRRPEGLGTALPIVALYSLAGYRVMPALQLVYSNATKVRFTGEALDRLHRDYLELNVESEFGQRDPETIAPTKSIELSNLTYRYPSSNRPVISNLDLEVPANKTVGLVGVTGSGKTTVVDIILGLLEPTKGMLLVDGKPITGLNRRVWQQSLGYVPQQIFLTDDTVAANIAFGSSVDQIDRAAVERSAKIANLHAFIVNELPNSYETIVGENGVRLSGGQRQRIGIARALYRGPKVLILDEATSALDGLTEQAVMDAVHNLGGKITIVLVAHRLTTIRECDRIFLLESGGLAAEGSYDDLIQSNVRFHSMATT